MAIQISKEAKDLIRSTFFGKDFSTYRAEIIDNLRDTFGQEVASNIVASEQGVMLIEVISYALSTLSWYGDRQADETTLSDVRIRDNAVTIARQLGYKPYEAVPAVADITLTLDAPAPAKLTIPKGRKLTGPGGLVFETIAETEFDVGESGPKTITVREGETLTELFTSDGSANQRFLLETIPTNTSIAEGTVSLTVGGRLWSAVEFLPFDQLDVFEVEAGRSPAFVRTGDGVAGNIPPTGAQVEIEYFVTRGPNGAVASNTITSFVDPLVTGSFTLTGTITQPDPSTPGSFPESIISIKTNAPLVYQSAQRGVTNNDLDGLINSFVDPTYGAVAKGRATTPRSSAEDAQLQTHISDITSSGVSQNIIDSISDYWNTVLQSNCQANVVLAQILSFDSVGRYVSAPLGLARALETYLDSLVESTVKVKVVDGAVNLLSINMTISVKILSNIVAQAEIESIKTEIATETQTYLLNRDYGQSIQISDLYRTLDSITGVDYVNISITNQPTRKDEFGNLFIEDYEVITMGSLPVVNVI